MATSTPYATTNQVRNPGVYRQSFSILGADIANGDILTTWTPGHNFRILGAEIVVTKATTGAGATALYTPKIGTVAITGAALTPTLATTTPAGKVLASTATALNTGTTTDTITVTVSAVTAFTAGTITYNLVIQNTDNT